jgi:hypothetical protein
MEIHLWNTEWWTKKKSTNSTTCNMPQSIPCKKNTPIANLENDFSIFIVVLWKPSSHCLNWKICTCFIYDFPTHIWLHQSEHLNFYWIRSPVQFNPCLYAKMCNPFKSYISNHETTQRIILVFSPPEWCINLKTIYMTCK